MAAPACAWRALRQALLVVAAQIVMFVWLSGAGARAQEAAEAARGPPLNLALFVSSRTDRCYERGDIAAVEALAARERDRINARGGIGGRPVAIKVLDDARDPKKAIANMRAALADPTMLAMVGLSNSNIAKAVFDAVGSNIRASGIPFLSHISVNSVFADAKNVFTTQASQDDERLPVMAEFIRFMKFSRPAFAGLTDSVFSAGLGDGLARRLGAGALVADLRLKPTDDGIEAADVERAVAQIAETAPDILVLGVGGTRSKALLEALARAGVTPALFVSGRIESLPEELIRSYPNAIYQLAWDRLPETDNDRLRRQLVQDDPAAWVFGGQKVPQAPGWAKGECEVRPEPKEPDPLTEDNLRAIETGTRYADMVGLTAAAAGSAKRGADMATLRAHLLRQLTTTYAAGRGVYKGSFENWSFHPTARSAVRTPFVVILPTGLGRTQLAPVQFVRVKDGSFRRIGTYYLDIDLISADRVEDSEKTFFASFYLSLRNAGGAAIEQIEFTNAYLDPRTGGRQITVEVLHPGGTSDAYPEAMKIYKVSGRFVFDPRLEDYPFDTQRFSIDLQPRRGDAPFIIQPPPVDLRDGDVETDGWYVVGSYVGTDEDFVPALDAFTHEPSVVPFYKASYVWLMKRQTTDYYLRVVVPLAFILIVAYLSIFIPLSHFEAIVTIQVTALLSAVALYLSLPQLDSDSATLSDRIFVFNYMMVSLMIVISILRMNKSVAKRRWMRRSLTTLHIAGVPVLLAIMAWYVLQVGAA